MRGVVGKVAGRPEFAVADAIDPSLDLLPHRLRNRRRDLCGDGGRVGYLGIGEPRWHLLPALGRRQSADMRGSDPCHTFLHLPVLPLSVRVSRACDPATWRASTFSNCAVAQVPWL